MKGNWQIYGWLWFAATAVFLMEAQGIYRTTTFGVDSRFRCHHFRSTSDVAFSWRKHLTALFGEMWWIQNWRFSHFVTLDKSWRRLIWCFLTKQPHFEQMGGFSWRNKTKRSSLMSSRPWSSKTTHPLIISVLWVLVETFRICFVKCEPTNQTKIHFFGWKRCEKWNHTQLTPLQMEEEIWRMFKGTQRTHCITEDILLASLWSRQVHHLQVFLQAESKRQENQARDIMCHVHIKRAGGCKQTVCHRIHEIHPPFLDRKKLTF